LRDGVDITQFLSICYPGVIQRDSWSGMVQKENPSSHRDNGLVLPETWVTLYSEDMGNSFAPNGLSSGSSLHSVSSKYPKS
jgi:hypothetical protein